MLLDLFNWCVFCFPAENLLRTDPVEDKEGFFIALFVRKVTHSKGLSGDTPTDSMGEKHTRIDGSMDKKEIIVPPMFSKFCKFRFYAQLHRKKRPTWRRGSNETVK